MQPIEFRKDYAQYVLDCLRNGLPIEPPGPDGWAHFDQLMLAGAVVFAIGTHGPVMPQPDLTPEQQAESDGGFGEELLGTVAFLSQLCMAVEDDEYDDQWEPVIRATICGFRPESRCWTATDE